MKLDLYTKAILTIIALALVCIVHNQYANPTIAHAQVFGGGHAFSASDERWTFYDADQRIVYSYTTNGRLYGKYKMNRLGEPLVDISSQP